MAITEAPLPYDKSKRDFLGIDYLFSRNRSRGNQPPRRPSSRPPLSQPEPPDRGRFKLTRRQALKAGGLIAGGAVVAAVFKPWEWFFNPPLPEISESDTLESLVAKAKKAEEEFSGNDLSNESVRNNFTDILANIYAKDAPSGYTAEQITGSLIWAKNSDEFINLVLANSEKQRGEKGPDYFVDIPAITTDNKKIVVNLANPVFNTSLRRNGFPQDWNSLKSLRRILLHEFVHFTTTPKKDDAFFELTDIPETVENPIIEGFVVQFREEGQDKELFHVLNELAIETITSERSNRLFGLTPPIVFIEQGVDLSIAQTRCKLVLEAAAISMTDLERFSRESNLYGFLTTLSSKVDFPPDMSLAGKINYAVSVLEAITYNNQTVIQDYIGRTRLKPR